MRRGAAVVASVVSGAAASVALAGAWGNPFNLLDHLVGGYEQFIRHGKSEHPGRRCGASVVTLRIVCPIETAVKRVRSRSSSGERGPTAGAMLEIDAELL